MPAFLGGLVTDTHTHIYISSLTIYYYFVLHTCSLKNNKNNNNNNRKEKLNKGPSFERASCLLATSSVLSTPLLFSLSSLHCWS